MKGSIPVLDLPDAPRERGLAHGESLRGQIREVLADWQKLVERNTGDALSAVARDFRRATKIEDAMRRFTPGLVEEIDGMAAGAGVDADALFMFNCPDESEWFLTFRGHDLALPEARGCSSIGERLGPDGPLIGQNMDIPGAADGYQVLLRIHDPGSGRETLLFSLAGLIGMIGVSSAPLGVVNNSLRQLCPRIDGVPVNGVVRGVLMQSGLGEAVRFLREIPHATGHNYILAGSDGVRMFECSANDVVEVTPPESGARVIHTNHPLTSGDTNPDRHFDRSAYTPNTGARLVDLERSVLGRDAPCDVAAIQAALGAHSDPDYPVCRHVTDRGSNFTAGCVVYELTQPAVLHVAPGPPCETRFQRFEVATRSAAS